MKQLATILILGCLLVVTADMAWAQPDRVGQDVIWARDIAGATITMDGMLDEAVWSQAETLELNYGEVAAAPGSGYQIEGNPVPAEPTDPVEATLYVLRDGNILWLGLEVADKSVGGGLGLFNFDGIMMSITDRSQRPDDFASRTDANYFSNGVTNAEFAYTWWNPADTTDGTTTYADGTALPAGSPTPGIEPRFFGDYGVGFNQGNDGDNRDDNDRLIWDAVTTVDGIANDDTHGDDVGYVMEMMINLDSLGYDMTQAGGDVLPWNFAIQDDDYSWPENTDLSFLSRTFWQNKWLNNFNEGVAFVYGDPSVTVNSGAVPAVTAPDFTIGSASLYGAPVIDGSLDENVWNAVEPAVRLQYEMEDEDMDAWLPGAYAPYGVHWFRPDLNGDGRAAIVVDPTIGEYKFAFEGRTLYVGVNADDQAISGIQSENGRDGIRLIIQSPDSIQSDQTWHAFSFEFTVDSTGALQYARDAMGVDAMTPADGITAAVALKGNSTVADPTDVDEGYQIEIAIDLEEVLGYPADLNQVYLTMTFFDGDILQNQADSYATRTWIGGERTNGASIYAYMDPNTVIGTAIEDEVAGIPTHITLHGNYPNPFSAGTMLRYALPQSGEVAIEVFDVLGRRVARVDAGAQGAGIQEVPFDAAQLASGLYIYRIEVTQPGSTASISREGRMLLVK